MRESALVIVCEMMILDRQVNAQADKTISWYIVCYRNFLTKKQQRIFHTNNPGMLNVKFWKDICLMLMSAFDYFHGFSDYYRSHCDYSV